MGFSTNTFDTTLFGRAAAVVSHKHTGKREVAAAVGQWKGAKPLFSMLNSGF